MKRAGVWLLLATPLLVGCGGSNEPGKMPTAESTPAGAAAGGIAGVGGYGGARGGGYAGTPAAPGGLTGGGAGHAAAAQPGQGGAGVAGGSASGAGAGGTWTGGLGGAPSAGAGGKEKVTFDEYSRPVSYVDVEAGLAVPVGVSELRRDVTLPLMMIRLGVGAIPDGGDDAPDLPIQARKTQKRFATRFGLSAGFMRASANVASFAHRGLVRDGAVAEDPVQIFELGALAKRYFHVSSLAEGTWVGFGFGTGVALFDRLRLRARGAEARTCSTCGYDIPTSAEFYGRGIVELSIGPRTAQSFHLSLEPTLYSVSRGNILLMVPAALGYEF